MAGAGGNAGRVGTFVLLGLLLVPSVRALPTASPNAQAALARGEEALRSGDLVAAMRAFREAVDSDPESWEAYDGLARAWRRAGDLEAAEREFRRAVLLAPATDAPAQHLAELLDTGQDASRRREGIRWLGENAAGSPEIQLWVAREARKAGDLVTARAAAERALARDPDSKDALVERILLHRDGLQYERAEELAHAFIARYPREPDTYLMLGRIFQIQDRLEAAQAQFGKALELAPQNAAALTRMGEILMVKGQFPEAQSFLERAVSAAPNRYQAHYLLGGLYLRQGKREAAAQALERFREIKDSLRASTRLAGGAAMVDE